MSLDAKDELVPFLDSKCLAYGARDRELAL
jgi:hypothetical protein